MKIILKKERKKRKKNAFIEVWTGRWGCQCCESNLYKLTLVVSARIIRNR